MTTFDDHTALTPTGSRVYGGHIHPDWFIFRGPNGGHVAAVVLRAMTMEVADPARAPRSLTVHYMRPPVEGPIEVHASVERAGRSLSTVSARLIQDGKPMALGIGSFAAPREGPAFEDAVMPDVPRFDEIAPAPDRPEMPFINQHDYRWVLGADVGLGTGDVAETGVWMRLKEPRTVDAVLAAQLMDAWAPAVHQKVGHTKGVPTTDLTVHFRRTLPVAGAGPGDFTFGMFRTRTAAEGYIEEDGELFDAHGVLLAQSRQLAIVLT